MYEQSELGELQTDKLHTQYCCYIGSKEGFTFRKPYSVRATKATGTVEMKQPAMGMKEQMKTNRDSRPIPGIARAHIPAAVKAVFTRAIRACTHACWSLSLPNLADRVMQAGAEIKAKSP